jgi:predicted nucleotidyltransferase component of viral defense system
LIDEKFVDLYARNSGLRDKLVAERDVVLTYALRALFDAGLTEHMAFKGGTCLRKMIFGSTGRFSEDLDFTLATVEPEDDVLIRIVETFDQEQYGISFVLGDYYKTVDETSFGGEIQYSHSWNSNGHFRLQVSLREDPTLPVARHDMRPQSYFGQLEFHPFAIRSLDLVEMIAEKVRAAFQRVKVRDLYDLYLFTSTPFNGELLRRMVVLKLWQTQDPFDADAFFDKLRGASYDWEDLRRLVRATERVDSGEILARIEERFGVLRSLTALERQVIADARRNKGAVIADSLRAEIRALAGAGP